MFVALGLCKRTFKVVMLAYALTDFVDTTCHLNLVNLNDVQERHITNRKCRDSGVHGQFNRSSRLWDMTVGVGGVRSLTTEVLANLTKGVPPLPALTGETGSELASSSSGMTCI
ncbi:hypothetical protein J6590_010892 [Homalodisca vitripennis]|nr:hypothetical protein J6590_010892 [Homalodisca vitripennis]